MSFLIDATDEDVRSGKAHESYVSYLHSIRDQLPQTVFEFAVAAWHYNHGDPKCPHDSWVQEIKIREIAEGDRHEIRKTQLELTLLGSYHDRLLRLSYYDVASHSIHSSRSHKGYGDWLVDEICLSESGLVLHEIKFSNDTVIKIECGDITFEERPTETP